MVYMTNLWQQLFAAAVFISAVVTIGVFAATTVGLRAGSRRRRI